MVTNLLSFLKLNYGNKSLLNWLFDRSFIHKIKMVRTKLEMKKIENLDRRHVCFSKRRSGIMKKAFELSVLCKAEIGVIIFSEAGKFKTFGSPNIDYVINNYITKSAVPDESEESDLIKNKLDRYNELRRELEHQKKERDKKKQQLAGASELRDDCPLFRKEVSSLDISELPRYKEHWENLKYKVERLIAQKKQNSPHDFNDGSHPMVPGKTQMNIANNNLFRGVNGGVHPMVGGNTHMNIVNPHCGCNYGGHPMVARNTQMNISNSISFRGFDYSGHPMVAAGNTQMNKILMMPTIS